MLKVLNQAGYCTSNRSSPFSSSWGTAFLRPSPVHFGKFDLKSGSCETPGQVFSVGVPRIL